MLMLDKGRSASSVAECLGIDISTVYRYKNAYLHGGEEGLFENRHKEYWGLLNSCQLSALREELTKHVYTDAKSVAKWIKSAFGVEYTIAGTVDLLNRIYFSYKKRQKCLVRLRFSPRRLVWVMSYPIMPDTITIRIKQLFLLPYSPNLNLIERLWKFLKKKVINTGFYRTKEEFRKAIRSLFEHIERFKKELETLLTLYFRLINSQTISF
nr:transposase [Bacteroides graminisolvens]